MDLCVPWTPKVSRNPNPPQPGPRAPQAAAASVTLMSPQGTALYEGLTDLPPLVERAVSAARLDHRALDAAELKLAPDLAALVATRRFPG